MKTIYNINDLLSIDLNLLPILFTVLTERHVTRSAVKLGMSQPKISRALEKLRLRYNDDLLVRGLGGYELTPAGQKILAELREAMPSLISLATPSFDPATSQRLFRVVMSPFGACLATGALAQKLGDTNIVVQIVNHDDRAICDMAEARNDLALYENVPPQDLSYANFCDVPFKCILGCDHTFQRKKFSLKEYLEMRHIVFSVYGHKKTVIDNRLEQLGKGRRSYNIMTPFVYGTLRAVLDEGLVFTVPEPMAVYLARTNPIRLVDPPEEIGMFNFSLVWHPVYDRDPDHIWFRDALREIVRDEMKRIGSGFAVKKSF